MKGEKGKGSGRSIPAFHLYESLATCKDLMNAFGGHSHAAGVEQVGNVKGGRTWLVNPGTVAGLAAPATWVLGDLAAMRFQVFPMAA